MEDFRFVTTIQDLSDQNLYIQQVYIPSMYVDTPIGGRGRIYTEVAQKFANVLRNDLVYRHRSQNRKNLNMVTLIKSFDLLDKPQAPIKKLPEPNRLYTTKQYRKQKKQIVQSFKQKLKHNLEESRLKKQERNQHLGNMARRQRSFMQTCKLSKKDQMLDRKKKQAIIIKSNLGKFRQSLDQVKQQNQLEHAFKCFQRRINKYSTKSFSSS